MTAYGLYQSFKGDSFFLFDTLRLALCSTRCHTTAISKWSIALVIRVYIESQERLQ